MKESVTQSMAHGLPRNLLPLGQGVSPHDVSDGDLLSIAEGCIVPFTADLPFAGIANGLGKERGVWKVSALTQGTISEAISGLSPDTKLGSQVFAMRSGNDQSFDLDGLGVPIGTLVGIELIGIVRINVGGIEQERK